MADGGTPRKSTDDVDGGAERLLRLDEVADRLAISRSKAWLLVTGKELKAARIGRSIRVRPTDLDAFIERATDED